MSSTSKSQRRIHLIIFCAALTLPVTICTFASRRMPDIPIGSLMPACKSIINSCGKI
ncbi:secreted protein [methanotrophic bacterial endosymbiont of Bathymodiolus sp.]|nr:secreted protein [methanotrophic bacterial endosymbiont of Bathymodiolus sp.]